MGFVSVTQAAAAYKQGRFVIIVDDEDRENEGDLCLAAEHVTPAAVNFMAREGRGLVCVSLTEERCDELDLHADGRAEHVQLRDGLHGVRRGARQDHDRHLGGRPRGDGEDARRPEDEAAGPAAAGPHVPAPGEEGRRPEAGGPDGGVRRPRADRRASRPPPSSARS